MSSGALETRPGFWARLPVAPRAIVSGLSIGLVAANVWPFLLIKLGMPLAALAEAAFLAIYVWWASGKGWPRATSDARRLAFRTGPLSRAQWIWGLIAALSIAASVHAALVGMWFAGFPVTPLLKEVVELWQPPQSPVAGCAGSIAAVGRVTIVTPYQLLPVS